MFRPPHIPAVPISGLILIGGTSSRLGEDKTVMEFRGLPHREYLGRLLEKYCDTVFFSCRPGQEDVLTTRYPLLVDAYAGIGPFGAILTALESDEDRAWLVLAADLPLFDEEALQFLIDQRDPRLPVTAYTSKGLPQPLAAIWEPRALTIMRKFHHDGNYSPMDVLRNSLIHLVIPPEKKWLLNVNTPEDLARVRQLLAD